MTNKIFTMICIFFMLSLYLYLKMMCNNNSALKVTRLYLKSIKIKTLSAKL